ncbi:phenylacetate-CoA oxygenase subunit PaaJ [Blastococcus sp. PRF04-17]|nr:1,2-phenylacetyl-CoA epoxidase subunit PaaD [Blastococcus sp. PRF04-17]UOY02324.1 phenylacetate-CoA oxygenase subunit PaaJ [Blastococcus sp. PRF04-17]
MVTLTKLDARAVAARVTDPELPTVTLADLGVLRDVRTERDGTVVVEITPTYSGCPAMGVMRADLLHALHRAGFPSVEVRTVLSPAWSTDWITPEGRRKLAEGGIAPPGRLRSGGPARYRWSWGRPGARRTARSAARPTPRSSASSARPRARHCAAAGRVASRSST